MQHSHDIPLLKIYTSKLDPKGRCSFPSELREGKKNVTVYVFFSPKHQKALAVFDPETLKKRFPAHYSLIPLQKCHINDQWKILLWDTFSTLLKKPLSEIKELTFIGTGTNYELVEIYFSQEGVNETIQLRQQVADTVMDTLLNIAPPFSCKIGQSKACFGIIDQDPPASMTTNL